MNTYYFALAAADAATAILVGNAALPLWAALAPTPKQGPLTNRRRCAVILPAWNARETILTTLDSIKNQLLPNDRVLVVADHCTDDTASLARTRPDVEVYERRQGTHTGKTETIFFALGILRPDPPPVVVILAADCTLSEGGLAALVEGVTRTSHPQQAAYRVGASENLISDLASSWAKEIRPRGKERLDLPTVLQGSGMAFSWTQLAAIPRPSATSGEERLWTIDLGYAGILPRFCANARVTTQARLTNSGTPRQRWERGTWKIALVQAPRLLFYALRNQRISLVVLALDLMTPTTTALLPISFVLLCLDRSSLFARALLASLFLLGSGLLISWRVFRSDVSFFRLLTGLPSWLVDKYNRYRALLSGAGKNGTSS